MRKVVFIVGGVIVLGLLTAISFHYRRAPASEHVAAEVAQRQTAGEAAREAVGALAERTAATLAACRSNADAMSASYENLFKQRLYLEAASVVRDCAEATSEPAFKRAVDAAYIADYKATADDAKESFLNRLLSLEKLEMEHPEAYRGRERQHAMLRKQRDEREAKEAAADPIHCAVDEATDAYFCYDVRAVRDANGTRRALLYTGGPNGVRRTNFTISANCPTKVIHLKDSDGVSFVAASYEDATKHSRRLLDLLCAAKIRSSQTK